MPVMIDWTSSGLEVCVWRMQVVTHALRERERERERRKERELAYTFIIILQRSMYFRANTA